MVLRILTAVSLAFLAAACSPYLGPAQYTMPVEAREWCGQVIQELNRYRTQKGLEPLQDHNGLHALSLNHSKWLLRKRGTSFMHGSNVSHSGGRYRARVARIEYGMEAWGENVAYISDTPKNVAKQLIIMWRASPSHHKAMIDNWTHVGVGICVDDDGAVFATMNFGRTATD